jgi:hypothetical protein
VSDPVIVVERKEIVLRQVPGVGPPGEINGGFSVDGEPPFNLICSIPGTLVVATGQTRLYMPRAGTIGRVDASIGVAPQGLAVIFDVNKNGATIFTTQANRPTILPGSNASLDNTPDVTTFVAGDYYTIDCDQIGTVAAGVSAVVTIWYF